MVASVKWAEALAGWEAFSRSAGHSPGTIRFRGYLLRQFAAEVGKDPFEVGLADCVAFVGRPGLSAETRKFDRSALRSFYRWALDLALVEADPTDRLPSIRIPDVAPGPTPDAVFAKAIANATDRDRLILLLGAYAGLRRGEIAGLGWSDVVDGRLRVRAAKGGRVRVLPLHPTLAAELAAERQRRDAGGFGSGFRYKPPEGAGSPYVFPGPGGGPMLPDGVGKAARRALGGAAGAHSLRHRFAQRALDGTGNLLAVSTLLGHARPETTARHYVRAGAAALEAAVKAAG